VSTEVQVALIGGLGTVVVGLLTYLGVTRQARAARAATDHASRKDERDSALKAWESLLDPYRDEVKQLRAELARDREAWQEQQRHTDAEQRSLRTMIEDLTDQVQTWQRVAKTIARWATSLRDEVLRLGGTVPATPEELLTLQAIDHGDDEQT
jgi:DNA repair exonuclease SbcCD ATPase subunit